MSINIKKGEDPTSKNKQNNGEVYGLVRVHLLGSSKSLIEEGRDFLKSTNFNVQKYTTFCQEHSESVTFLRFSEGMLTSKIHDFIEENDQEYDEDSIEIYRIGCHNISEQTPVLTCWEFLIRQFPTLKCSIEIFYETDKEYAFIRECAYLLSNGVDGIEIKKYGGKPQGG